MARPTYKPLSCNERKVLLAICKGPSARNTAQQIGNTLGLAKGRVIAAGEALARRGYAITSRSSVICRVESTTEGEQLAAEIVAAVREAA